MPRIDEFSSLAMNTPITVVFSCVFSAASVPAHPIQLDANESHAHSVGHTKKLSQERDMAKAVGGAAATELVPVA